MAFAMPNLNVLMSIGSILLLGFWFFYPGAKLGLSNLRKNKLAIGLIGLYLIHVVWLFNTEDFDYALKDLRIKLPLLVFGLVLGSMPISKVQGKIVFFGLSVGIWVACISTYINYFSLPPDIGTHRDLVTGISHIRLSLLMVLQLAGFVYFWHRISKPWKVYVLISALNVPIFFNLIQSLTGLVVFILLGCFSLLYMVFRRGKKGLGWSVIGLFVALLVLGAFQGKWYYEKYFTVQSPETEVKLTTTALGNQYNHYNENQLVENGHLIYINLAEREMADAWNKRSDIVVDYDQGLGIDVANTLIRYLTSKGLTKDAEGVASLSDSEIEDIEMGVPSILYTRYTGLRLRLHTFFFGIHLYSKTKDASGLSFFQRVVYWNVGVELVKKNYLLGTGTGDVKNDFIAMYDELDSNLDEKYRLRAHNQFLTFFASFGIFGFVFFIAMFLYAFKKRSMNYLATCFYLLAFLSCLTEDTLETQAGVTFFAFFFALFSKPFVAENREKPSSPQTSQS